MLEYQASPIWVYNSSGELLGNGWPEEMSNVPNIKETLDQIENEYDSLFENTETVFRYRGFQNDDQRRIFMNKVSQVIELIKKYLGQEYEFEVRAINL